MIIVDEYDNSDTVKKMTMTTTTDLLGAVQLGAGLGYALGEALLVDFLLKGFTYN